MSGSQLSSASSVLQIFTISLANEGGSATVFPKMTSKRQEFYRVSENGQHQIPKLKTCCEKLDPPPPIPFHFSMTSRVERQLSYYFHNIVAVIKLILFKLYKF